MAAPFGFSAGDFIAALKLVNNVIHALRDSDGAGEEYRELVNELYTLETALLEVKRVELDDEQHAQRVALQQAASQCHWTIDEFWKKIQKYQPHLRSEGSSSKVKDGWRKVQWALCKKDDVASFRAKLRGHTGSINVLLMTVQMNSTAIDRKRNNRSRQTLEAQLQQNAFAHLGMLQDIANGVNCSVQQGKELLLSTATVFSLMVAFIERRTNVQIFQLALSLQNQVLSLPSQVERQQPVTFFDACGRVYPFHLEFINSAEVNIFAFDVSIDFLIMFLQQAFHAVLRVRFKDNGLVKIDRREYFIKETATDREIDLSRPWDQCFLPGQKADMSMIFHAAEGDTCPGCRRYCGDACTAEVVCSNCGMTVRRITDIEEEKKESTVSPASVLEDTMKDISSAGISKACRKRKRSIDNDEEVARFRRVRIVSKLQANPLHSSHGFAAVRGNAILRLNGIDPQSLSQEVSHLFKQLHTWEQIDTIKRYHQWAQPQRLDLNNQVPKGPKNLAERPGQNSPTMQQAADPQQPIAMGNSHTRIGVQISPLEDYKVHLCILEQHNKRRLLLARLTASNDTDHDYTKDGRTRVLGQPSKDRPQHGRSYRHRRDMSAMPDI